MALLVGSEVEGTTGVAGNSIFVEKPEAFRFVAAKTGTVETIKFRTGSGAQAATSVQVAIAANTGVAEGMPGTILGEGTFGSTPGSSATIEVSGFSVAVTSGTVYWLILLPIGGVIKIRTHKAEEAGASPSRVNSLPAKVKKASEVTVWELEAKNGPVFVAGVGPEGGSEAKTASGKAVVTLAATAKAALVQSVAGATNLLLSARAVATQTISAQGRSALIVSGTTKPVMTVSTTGTTARLTFTARATAKSGTELNASGSALLRITTKASINAVSTALGRTQLTLAGKLQLAAATTTAGKASLLLSDKASVGPKVATLLSARLSLKAKGQPSTVAGASGATVLRFTSKATVHEAAPRRLIFFAGRSNPSSRAGRTMPFATKRETKRVSRGGSSLITIRGRLTPEFTGHNETYSYSIGTRETVLAARVASALGSPCVLLFHEGGWAEQPAAQEPLPGEPLTSKFVTKMQADGPARKMNEEGFASFNFNWRQSRNGSPAYGYEIEDIEAAIEFVKLNATAFNGDPSKVVLLGGSSGSHLAFLTGLRMNQRKANHIRAVAGLSGPVNLISRTDEGVEEKEEGEDSNILAHIATFTGVKQSNLKEPGWLHTQPALITLFEELSPTFHISASMPKFYYSVSEHDQTPVRQGEEMTAAVAAAGQSARYQFAQPASGHGFGYFSAVEAEVIAFLRGAV